MIFGTLGNPQITSSKRPTSDMCDDSPYTLITSQDVNLDTLSDGLSSIAEDIKNEEVCVDAVDVSLEADAGEPIKGEVKLDLTLANAEQIDVLWSLLQADG